MGMLCSLMRRFMQLMLGAEAAKLFEEVVPAMADMLLKLLSLLESHYQGADDLLGGEKYSAGTGLRLLGSQEVGILFLSQAIQSRFGRSRSARNGTSANGWPQGQCTGSLPVQRESTRSWIAYARVNYPCIACPYIYIYSVTFVVGLKKSKISSLAKP
ncbi:hypothetical protein Dsin_018657 [Dipteronia sinensis]|uniref:Uncharacterized protein n=1 Tax=Dipteronia sinensis TaxID=43782 RepID=A0AAE0E299_9ROSI|nr:hypothetical protein Dsin_018657 [Dipteronia sinensis]